MDSVVSPVIIVVIIILLISIAMQRSNSVLLYNSFVYDDQLESRYKNRHLLTYLFTSLSK